MCLTRLLLSASVVVFLGTTLFGDEANLVSNGGFESLDEQGWVVGWTRSPGHPDNIVEVSGKHVQQGKYSLHMKWNAPAGVGEGANCDALSSKFPIKPVTSYQVVFYCHGGGNVFTFFYDKDGKEIEKARKYYPYSGRRFKQKSISFTSPDNATQMSLMFRVYPPSGEAWIDNVAVSKAGEGQWRAQVPNPSFEWVQLNGNVVGWKLLPGNAANVAEVTEEKAAFSRRCLHLKNDVQGSQCDAFSEDFPITGGVTYALSFSAIAPQKSGVFVFIYDKEGKEIGAIEAESNRHFFFQTKGDKFERVKIKFTPRLGAATMRMMFRVYGGGEAWIDGVQIEPGEATEYQEAENSQSVLLLNWHVWARGNEVPLTVSLYNGSSQEVKGTAFLKVMKEDELVDIYHQECMVAPHASQEVSFQVDTKLLGLGGHKLVFSMTGLPEASEEFFIIPPLERQTIRFGFAGYSLTGHTGHPPTRENIKPGLDLLSSAKMNHLGMHAGQTGNVWLLDEMAKRGIAWAPLANPVEATGSAKPEDWSLTSEGKPQVAVHASRETPHLSYISPLARKLAKEIVPAHLIRLKDHPGFSRIFPFGDDTFIARGSTWEDFRWGPLADYGHHAVTLFKQKTGLDAPRPTRQDLQKMKGIIPDNDPWLLWNHFRCEDVFADYIKVICDTIKDRLGAAAVSVHGAAWLPGWGFVTSSEQKTLSLPGYYLYPPSPFMHLYEVELVRLGAGNRDINVSPAAHNVPWGKWFIEEVTPEYERATFHSILAAGGKGITYYPFQIPEEFDEGHPAVWEEFRRQGRLVEKYGKMLYELRRAKEPVGLLISFATDVYRLLDEPEPGEVFPFRKGHKFQVAGTFFSMLRAQIPVEMVDEERILSGDLSHYKVIYLADVTVLPASVAKVLEDFIAKGGIVMMDNLCQVDIKGAKRLPFNACILPVDKRDRSHRSAKPLPYSPQDVAKAVSQLREAFDGIVVPSVITDSLDIAVRRFVSDDGEEYLFVVNLNQDDRTKARLKFVGRQEAVDVFSGHRIATGETLELPPAGAALLSFTPPVSRIDVSAPSSVTCGESLSVSAKFYSGKKLVRGVLPVRLTVLNSKGEVEKEWSKYQVAKSGTLAVSINLPFHADPGNWHVLAEDLLSGQVATATVKVLPAIEFEVEKRSAKGTNQQEFSVRLRNRTRKDLWGMVSLLADETLTSSLRHPGKKITLRPGEEETLSVTVSADDEFALGPQAFTFILKVDGLGAVCRKCFATLTKGEQRKDELQAP